jgi:3-oxoacyl-[acyl-carrier protein] reductase
VSIIDVAKAYDLSGRVAVLTGVGSGIGKATALTLASAGATIVGGDVDDAAAEATAKEIVGAGGVARAMCTDVTSRAEVDALVDGAVAEHGRIDIMGNIAGVQHAKPVVEVTDDELDRILAINLKSVVYGCQAALRHMIPARRGNIVNISSGVIDNLAPSLACYGMTKAAVAQLTKTVAVEVARLGIRCNAIAPGVIHTNFSRHHYVDESGNVIPEKVEEYKQKFSAMTPIGRVGEAQDVAWSVLYAVSDASEYTTGQILRPNGGQAMPW